MVQQETLEKLRQMKNADGELLWGEKSINNLMLLSDINLSHYLGFLDFSVENSKLDDSFKSTRSTHLDLLKFVSTLDIDLIDITQNIVDDYFIQYSHQAQSSINNKARFLKPFLSFFPLKNHISLDSYIVEPENNDDKMPRIKAEELSKAKFLYRKVRETTELADNKDYIIATKKLFVLEMIFYTRLSEKNIGKYFKGDMAHDDCSIFFKNNRYFVPKSLINLINEIHGSPKAYETLDVKTAIDSLKDDLSSLNMSNLSSKGAEKTTKTIFWTCPQCGREYEAIAENWCVKQYTENGENWIVCRERCAHE